MENPLKNCESWSAEVGSTNIFFFTVLQFFFSGVLSIFFLYLYTNICTFFWLHLEKQVNIIKSVNTYVTTKKLIHKLQKKKNRILFTFLILLK